MQQQGGSGHPNLAPSLPQPSPKCILGIVQRGETDMGKRSPAYGGPRKSFAAPCSPCPQSLPFSAPQIPPPGPAVLQDVALPGCLITLRDRYNSSHSPTLHCPALNHINPTNPPPENLTHNPKTLKSPRSSPKLNTSMWPSHPSPLPPESHIALRHTEQPLHGKTWWGVGEEMFYLSPHLPLISQVYF